MSALFLFDVNVLLALLDPGHERHALARRWWTTKAGAKWCTCEITRSAFVRLSCNPHVTVDPKSAEAAWNILKSNMDKPRHAQLSVGTSAFGSLAPILRRCQGYRQVTDAFLLHVAVANQAVFATFDQPMKHLSPDPSSVEVIPLY
ncbi:TA system VapC family ribonuclease toxin [Luteolibacter sp. Populi]|uniref:TA system VapC family ribonuclease toxin n=1 Tax=Luteolibacter sp. Populi TaxID=3230487 RepID=UPI003466CFDD